MLAKLFTYAMVLLVVAMYLWCWLYAAQDIAKQFRARRRRGRRWS